VFLTRASIAQRKVFDSLDQAADFRRHVVRRRLGLSNLPSNRLARFGRVADLHDPGDELLPLFVIVHRHGDEKSAGQCLNLGVRDRVALAQPLCLRDELLEYAGLRSEKDLKGLTGDSVHGSMGIWLSDRCGNALDVQPALPDLMGKLFDLASGHLELPLSFGLTCGELRELVDGGLRCRDVVGKHAEEAPVPERGRIPELRHGLHDLVGLLLIRRGVLHQSLED